IRASFNEPVEMTVFDWNSDTKEKDTVMTPMDSIRYYKSFLKTAMMSMEPQSGHVRAWVGGIDYKHFQYDNVIQGARQVGSTFKPFVYAAAIDQLRLSPCDILPDNQYCIEANKHGNPEHWCPKNSDGKYSGKMLTLKNALANSVNSITAQLIDRVGPKAVVSIAKNMGITGTIPEVPSIALGTADLSVNELVGAYGNQDRGQERYGIVRVCAGNQGCAEQRCCLCHVGPYVRSNPRRFGDKVKGQLRKRSNGIQRNYNRLSV